MLHDHVDRQDRLLPTATKRAFVINTNSSNSSNGSINKNGEDPMAAVAQLLDTKGIAIVDNGIDHAVLTKCSDFLCGQAQAAGLPQQASPPQPQHSHAAAAAGRKRQFVQSTQGRYHRTSFDAAAKEHIAAVRQFVDPVAKAFFGDSAWPNVVVSQCQFLASQPGSPAQFYHQDNAQRGLTVLIPLTAVSLPMGPTQLLPGTHSLNPSSSLAAAASLLPRLARQEPCKAEAAFGQMLVYDSRTLHRGMANLSQQARPVLVLRYDHKHTPPPGQSLPYTFAMRALGATLHTCSYLLGAGAGVAAGAAGAATATPLVSDARPS